MTSATFEILGPAAPQSPIVLSVPHAGRDYPASRQGLRHPVERLRALEDRHADRMADMALAGGVSAIVSHLPRLWIDLNRAESDLDPEMVLGGHGGGLQPSVRTRGGLGLIPRRLADLGDVWRSGLAAEDVAERIDRHHRPYHAALSELLARARARFGVAMLIDLHSMPPLIGANQAGIVLGDRFGKTCAPELMAVAESVFAAGGYATVANAPYAGGHIISTHADRAANIHALQVEVDRSLYLDAAFDRTGAGLARMQATVAELVGALARRLCPPSRIAAE
jgi:N-formylglutamate amidohydrolase